VRSTLEMDLQGAVAKIFTSEVLVVVAYSRDNNPDLMDIYVFDWQSGHVLWQRANTKIVEAHTELIKVPHPIIQNRTLLLDINTGTEIPEMQKTRDSSGHITCPSSYPESSIYFQWFAKFLKETGQKPVKECEYLKLGKVIFLSYYIYRHDALDNYLIAIDSDGKILEKFTLGEKLKGIGKDTFFVQQDHLIFISNKTILNIYAL